MNGISGGYEITGEELTKNAIKLVFEQISETIERTLNYIGEKIVSDAVKIIDQNKLIYKHNLRDKVTQQVINETEQVLLNVGSGAKYSVYIENGSIPHWPPVGVMREYVRFKIRPTLSIKEKRQAHIRKRKYADQLQQKINSIAFLISREISKKGTKAVPFLRLAFMQNREHIIQKIAADIQAELS